MCIVKARCVNETNICTIQLRERTSEDCDVLSTRFQAMTSNTSYAGRNLNELWKMSSKTSVLGKWITHRAFPSTGRAHNAKDGVN